VIEIRQVASVDELRAAAYGIVHYFGREHPSEEWAERWLRNFELERMLAAVDDGGIVGGAGAFGLRMTVPGGDQLATAGVTLVGVLPTHRRRGILRSMMRVQLDDAHERGEPLAALWASEETIYGRFGYGPAAFCGEIKLAHEYIAFAQRFEPEGTIRFLEPDEARDLVPPVYERVRQLWPGMFSRDDLWWEQRELKDPDERREGAGPKRWVAYERDGSVDAYAVYRHKPGWEEGSTTAELRVVEALAATPTAERDLWGYLLSIDWKATVHAHLLPPDHALFLLLATPRRLRYRMGDGLWVRLVDVGAALSGRTYAEAGSIVFEVQDEFCPWNDGRWKLEDGTASQTDDAADIALSAQSLGSAYLGGVPFSALGRAGRAEELTDGALSRADGMFRWDRHPWCPEIF
jgi:predicted acetyltransferase